MRLVNILLTNIAASRSAMSYCVGKRPWRRCASMSAAAPPVTIDMVEAAAARIGDAVDVTPVLTSAALDAATGHRLFFKCENLQRTGSFKARGAANAVFALDDATAARGVVCHSSGNHGAAVAAAARASNRPREPFRDGRRGKRRGKSNHSRSIVQPSATAWKD